MISQPHLIVNTKKLNAKDTPLLIIDNVQSGKIKKHPSRPKDYAQKIFDDQIETITYDGTQRLDDYGIFWVLGGDGTLNRTINNIHSSVKLFYSPCGTVNDFGKIGSVHHEPLIVGNVNKTRFCYCLAVGSFTSIGYETDRIKKKKWGKLAYMTNAVKQFKIHRIPLEITADGKEYKGEYTLCMILRSPRCFGFQFNRLYKDNIPDLYLLLIRSPASKGLIGLSVMFFRFFRTFFIGFDRPHHGNIELIPCRNVEIEANDHLTYCLDGEKYVADKKIVCQTETTNIDLTVVKRGFVR